MSRYDRTPTYNLQLVVHHTGLTPDTLRAWEKRYNLPQPDRTSGGHRLYSEYDIDVLKWLAARKEEGMSIGRAVALWRQLEAEGRDTLQAGLNPAHQPSTAMPVATGHAVAQVRQKWIAACLAFDEETAENELAQAFALYPPDTVCLEVLQNGLSEIGELWYRRQATVQQERFASALALGDILFADRTMTWLETLLDNHQISTLPLRRYLTAYRQAALANLAEAGEPIISWLERWTKPQER